MSHKTKLERFFSSEAWYVRLWRPLVAFIYLVICVFDFVAMPIIYEVYNEKLSPNTAVVEALKFKDAAAQVQVLQTLSNKRTWTPLTLGAGGLFHLAFGAIITGSAVTRGMEKTQRAKMLGNFLNADDDDADQAPPPPPPSSPAPVVPPPAPPVVPTPAPVPVPTPATPVIVPAVPASSTPQPDNPDSKQ
jgi:hypothetical protein